MASASETSIDTTMSANRQQEEEPPKLSPAQFRRYNQMADHMEYYHNHFRHTWEVLYYSVSPSTGNSSTSNTSSSTPLLTAPKVISTGLQFVRHLSVHHDIEEAHIFPVLAERMPAFQTGAAMLTQHKMMHDGLDKLEAYLNECRSGERELRREEVKEILDGFGSVLWEHLEREVWELGAERMRKYWTMEEMARMPM